MDILFPKKTLFSFFGFSFIYLVLLPIIYFPFTTILKPIPIFCLLFTSINDRVVNNRVKFFLIGALLFAVLGDIILTLPFPRVLEYGIGCFILAHVNYIILFVSECTYRVKPLLYFFLILIPVIFLFLWLKPYLGDKQIPVMIYLTVLLTMVLTAFQTRQYFFTITIGAALFLASDLILAFNVFIFNIVKLDMGVMFLYYFAQWLLVYGLLSRTSPPVNQ